MLYLILFLISFFLTALITPQVISLATKYKCLDLPGKRHVHKKATPRWGGMAFFFGVLPVVFVLPADKATISFFAASVVVLLIGMVDDRKALPLGVKFAGMLAATSIAVFGGDFVVRQLGTYGSLGNADLGRMSIPFTYFGILGVTNAMNLLDGLNGLAAGSSLLAFLFMGIAAAVVGNIPVALVCFAFTGALAAFLRFNFPVARIFMGDTGSLFLGFALALCAVQLTQDPQAPVNPVFPFLVLLLPIFDTMRVLILRIMRKRNPFRADKSHLHYLMTRKGISPVASVILLWVMTVVFGGIALLLMEKPAAFSLQFAFYAVLLLSFFTIALARRRHVRRESCRPPCEEQRHEEQAALAKVRIQ